MSVSLFLNSLHVDLWRAMVTLSIATLESTIGSIDAILLHVFSILKNCCAYVS